MHIFKIAICLLVASSGWVTNAQTRPPVEPARKQNARPAPSPTPPSLIGALQVNEPPADADDGDVIKVNTQLVSIPVRVMDKEGRFRAGLNKSDFKVFEDGQEQEIALFANEQQPFTVALMLDMSYSATFKITDIQKAAIEFIDQLRPQDKVMVVSFDEDVHVLTESTNDRNALYRAIRSTKIATGTSVYEALDLVINDRLKKIAGRKAVILFSDGVDTTSRRSTDIKNLSDSMECDSLIYTIRYDTFADVQKMKNEPHIKQPTIQVPGQESGPLDIILAGSTGVPSSRGTTAEEYRKADEYLKKLSDNTGGRTYPASTLTNLADAYSQIASELREFYSLAYYPAADRREGKRASVKIKVDQPGLVVRAREGFIRRNPAK